jgi:hypothetical protein
MDRASRPPRRINGSIAVSFRPLPRPHHNRHEGDDDPEQHKSCPARQRPPTAAEWLPLSLLDSLQHCGGRERTILGP